MNWVCLALEKANVVFFQDSVFKLVVCAENIATLYCESEEPGAVSGPHCPAVVRACCRREPLRGVSASIPEMLSLVRQNRVSSSQAGCWPGI